MNTKDILAKLLATENLTVVQENVSTASFDVKDRVLTLPQWNDMKDYTYDHLVGHEVGHALYTPLDGLHDAVSDKGSAYKSYLNVIEDARIEKLIQRKYQGLRREFVKSYRKMLAENFFGGDIDDINEMNLIDRVNVYFKCGQSAGVRIEKDEQHWIDEIAVAETWEQVVSIADRMFSEAEEKQEEQEKLESLYSVPDEDDDSDNDDVDESEEGEESAQGDDSDEDVSEDSADAESISSNVEEEESAQDDLQTPLPQDPNEEIASKTDAMLRDSIASEHSNNAHASTETYLTGDVDYKPFLTDYKNILNTPISSILYRSSEEPNIPENEQYNSKLNAVLAEKAKKLLVEFAANNKKTINYLVKEFEMKKSATNYSRSYISKTGVIDPVKMNSYRYNDDIFRKVNIIPDGKNHGMIMYLDWSGSMVNDLFKTVEQTLNLVHFCRQVNIPFRVYAFSNAPVEFYEGDEDREGTDLRNSFSENTLIPEEQYRLLEFFNNKMNKHDFNAMSARILLMSKMSRYLKGTWRLYGTPLDTTLHMASFVYNDFQRSNPVDIVNTIILTDGSSHDCTATTNWVDRDNNVHYGIKRLCPPRKRQHEQYKRTVIVDHITKKSYNVFRHDTTKNLIKLYKNRTGSTVIGYRIVGSSKSQFITTLAEYEKSFDSAEKYYELFKSNSFVNVNGLGYDKYFMIKGGKSLETSNGSFEVSESAKKGEILRGFRSANKKKLVSRKMLNEFIDEIS